MEFEVILWLPKIEMQQAGPPTKFYRTFVNSWLTCGRNLIACESREKRIDSISGVGVLLWQDKPIFCSRRLLELGFAVYRKDDL
jgi:hypothetical protein